MKFRRVAAASCVAWLLITAASLASPARAAYRWFKVRDLCLNLDTVHSKDNFVVFKFAESVMENCEDDPFYGGVFDMAIRFPDCKDRLSARALRL